jgi:hypothetical protein
MKKQNGVLLSFILVCFLTLIIASAEAASTDIPDTELFPFPILMTSAGQSADVQMLFVIASKSGIEAEVRPLIEADDFDPDVLGTLTIAVGGSGKGLGAAGIDAEQELERVQAILEKASGKCKIIVAHLGGEARRGELSDRFIKAVLPYADYILVVEGGDGSDMLFSKTAEELNIPIDFVKDIAEVGKAFSAKFQ